MRTVSELIFQLSVYHLNTFGMQRESSSPSSASDWSLTDINHGFLECLGMLGNVRQWKVGQEFQASLLCQKHDHHKLTKFQQRRWKHLCVTDRFQQEEEWSGGHWQRGTWTYSAAVRTETTKQLLAHTYCTYTMYILFLMCALLQKHSLADKELFLKSCFRIWCAGISLSYKKTQTFSQDSMQSCEKLTTSFLLPEVLSGIERQMLLVRCTCLTDDRQVSISINAEVDVPEIHPEVRRGSSEKLHIRLYRRQFAF